MANIEDNPFYKNLIAKGTPPAKARAMTLEKLNSSRRSKTKSLKKGK